VLLYLTVFNPWCFNLPSLPLTSFQCTKCLTDCLLFQYGNDHVNATGHMVCVSRAHLHVHGVIGICCMGRALIPNVYPLVSLQLHLIRVVPTVQTIRRSAMVVLRLPGESASVEMLSVSRNKGVDATIVVRTNPT
jgi:hypothetical protein